MNVTTISPIESKVDQVLGEKTNKDNANPAMFEQILDSFSAMEKTQVTAKSEIADVLMGNSDNSHGALIDLQKAELQMNFASAARDKVVQGTNQLLNMQI